MYLKKIAKLLILISSCCFSITHSYALNKPINGCDENSIHCIDLKGIPNNEFRILKITYNDNDGSKKTGFGCMQNTKGFLTLQKKEDERSLGKYSWEFFMCQDLEGKQCKLLGKDKFEMLKDKKGFYTKPKYYTVNASKIAAEFPACDPSQIVSKFPK